MGAVPQGGAHTQDWDGGEEGEITKDAQVDQIATRRDWRIYRHDKPWPTAIAATKDAQTSWRTKDFPEEVTASLLTDGICGSPTVHEEFAAEVLGVGAKENKNELTQSYLSEPTTAFPESRWQPGKSMRRF